MIKDPYRRLEIIKPRYCGDCQHYSGSGSRNKVLQSCLLDNIGWNNAEYNKDLDCIHYEKR